MFDLVLRWLLVICRLRFQVAAAMSGLLLLLAPAAHGADDIWQVLQRGGAVMLMRHGATSGNAEHPSLLTPGGCGKQRNLSPQGRADAEFIGKAIRDRSIPYGLVLSSEACRARDTAFLTFGKVETWTPLNLIIGLSEQEAAARKRKVAMRIASHSGPDNLILVTHLPNIEALLSDHLAPSDKPVGLGEIIVLKPEVGGSFAIVGRITIDDLRGPCPIKGNVNSKGQRIYHVPGGKFFDSVRINPGEGDRCFATEAEARSAGFRKSDQ